MILATRNGNRELRFGEAEARLPTWGSVHQSSAGQVVNSQTAGGLPAVGRAIRLVAGTIAALPLRVFQGYGADKQENDADWRAELLEEPVYGVSDFEWRWDVVSSLEASENAFLLKRKANGKIVELEHVPHYAVTGRVDRNGEKEFEIQFGYGKKTLSAADILHIRGNTVGGGPFGVSKFHEHRDPLGAMIAAQRFEGSYFRNSARPDLAVIFPQGVTRDQAAEWKQEWDGKYGGPENAGMVIPLGGGATIQPIPLNMRDAQFIESRQMHVEDVGRIMDVDAALLGAESRTDVRQTALDLFLRLQLPPRLRRITGALRADPDLFGGTEMYPEFLVDDLMFADPLTRSAVEHQQIQDGTLLVDEARARRGLAALPPIPEDPSQEPGKVPQITPVGGAPNPTTDLASTTSSQE